MKASAPFTYAGPNPEITRASQRQMTLTTGNPVDSKAGP